MMNGDSMEPRLKVCSVTVWRVMCRCFRVGDYTIARMFLYGCIQTCVCDLV